MRLRETLLAREYHCRPSAVSWRVLMNTAPTRLPQGGKGRIICQVQSRHPREPSGKLPDSLDDISLLSEAATLVHDLVPPAMGEMKLINHHSLFC